MRCGTCLYRNSRRAMRGFAIAAVLYVLGLIGVTAGVLFSGYSQILRSGATVQNNMIIKSDLQSAANTLSAEAVLSSDGITLCLPRSVHQTSGDPCAAASVALIQFGDYTGSQLPANFATAGASGSPTEVGVFTAGSGVKVLDSYGHTYIYCRWENPRSNPAAPAFVLLSAGPDGKLQTRCGDSSAQGDDGYLAVSVGAAINRAAMWQANGTGNVIYGAVGSQVVIDNSGDITAAGNLSALSAAITNAITASSLATSGNIVSSGNITGDNLTATGSVNGASGSFGNLSGSGLNISGAATVVGTSTLGNLSAGASTLNSLNVSNNASVGGGLAVQGGDIVLANGYGFAETDNKGVARHLIALDANNDIVIGSSTNNIIFYAGNAEAGWFDTSGDFTAFGTVNGQNGSFDSLSAGATTLTGTLTGTNANFSGTVTAANSTFATLNSTNFTTTNATVTGTLTANNFTLSGLTTGGIGNFTNLNVTNLTASNNITASGNITAGSTVSGTNISATGTVSGATGSFTSLSATSLTVNGNELVKGNLQVQGTSFLSSTGIGTSAPQSLLQVYGGEMQVGNSGNTCNTSNGGAIRFTGNVLYYCDGTSIWRSIYGSGGSGGSGSGSVNVGTQYQIAYFATNGSTLSGDSTIVTDSSNDLLVTSGKIGIGSTNPINLLDIGANGGIHIAVGTPTNTSFALYNVGGSLYWNGSAIGSGGGGSVSGTANYIPVFTGSSAISNSVMYQSGSRIGIGSTNPINTLDINGTGIHLASGTPGSTIYQLYNSGGTLYWNGSPVGSGGGGSSGTGLTGYDAIWTSATTIGTGLLYESAGYVGIGTTVPNSTLEIYDNGDGIILSMAGFQQGATQYYDADAYSYIDVDTANVGGLFLEGLSNSRTESGINMDGTVADTVLNLGTPAIKLSGEKRSGTGLTSLANNELVVDVENFWNGPLFDVNGGGYVGIGTSAPQATLDVNGYMKLAAQTAAPLTCASNIKGTVAMTTHNGLCFCNGSAWEKAESPTTACAW